MGGTPLLPAVGLGTAPLGGLYAEVPPTDAAAAVAEAVEIGYRYFDTAPLYGYGAAERALGRGLQGREPGVAVSTKVGRIIDEDASRPTGDMFAGSTGAASWDFSADGVRQSLEASLKRLDQTAERTLFSAAMARGVQVIAAGVYNSGILAGANAA